MKNVARARRRHAIHEKSSRALTREEEEKGKLSTERTNKQPFGRAIAVGDIRRTFGRRTFGIGDSLPGNEQSGNEQPERLGENR